MKFSPVLLPLVFTIVVAASAGCASRFENNSSFKNSQDDFKPIEPEFEQSESNLGCKEWEKTLEMSSLNGIAGALEGFASHTAAFLDANQESVIEDLTELKRTGLGKISFSFIRCASFQKLIWNLANETLGQINERRKTEHDRLKLSYRFENLDSVWYGAQAESNWESEDSEISHEVSAPLQKLVSSIAETLTQAVGSQMTSSGVSFRIQKMSASLNPSWHYDYPDTKYTGIITLHGPGVAVAPDFVQKENAARPKGRYERQFSSALGTLVVFNNESVTKEWDGGSQNSDNQDELEPPRIMHKGPEKPADRVVIIMGLKQ